MGYLLEDYNVCKGTLEEISRDSDNNVSMVPDADVEHSLINFDGVTKRICKKYRGGKLLASCDGYIVNNDTRYLIEFKNQSEGNLDKAILREKAFDSLSLLALNENITRQKRAENTVLIIVYNNENCERGKGSYDPSDSTDKLIGKMKGFANQRGVNVYPQKFGMEKYEGSFYKSVYTVDIKQFRQDFMKLLFDK